MKIDFVFSAAAEKEVKQSFDWYEEQIIGLGVRFVETIDNALNAIALNPEAYPKKRANKREFIIGKFPFIIIYEYLKKENTMYVLHIFHTKRNPKFKYKRK